jgi:HAD superfamily hydrolase (TIGR01662 family)
MNVDLVIPTIGRRSLDTLLLALASGTRRFPGRIFVVDDRKDPSAALSVRDSVVVLRTSGCEGPAAARNVGWRASHADWIAFLDDDVVPARNWYETLVLDLARLGPEVAASQARLHVPLPSDRKPTNWERDVAGLERSAYITADMAYRRAVLEAVGGFDEHFELAYREDADLALRVLDAGYRIERGARVTAHPVGAAPWHATLRRQRGNAADARMRRKHGRSWRERAQARPGRLATHSVTTAALLTGVVGLALRNRRLAGAAFVIWLLSTLEFLINRLRRGPLHWREVRTLAATSALIPPLAVYHRLRGEWRERRRARAVLFDQDGTLVVDVPYNGDPERVRPVDDAARALTRLRAHGVQVGVVSNQRGIALGLLTESDVRAVNARVDALLGPFAVRRYCPHDSGDGCLCRKPQPGMVTTAARALGIPVRQCVVVGDTGADLAAAQAAGCRGILVPNAQTRREEVRSARVVAPHLEGAVDLILGRSS